MSHFAPVTSTPLGVPASCQRRRARSAQGSRLETQHGCQRTPASSTTRRIDTRLWPDCLQAMWSWSLCRAARRTRGAYGLQGVSPRRCVASVWVDMFGQVFNDAPRSAGQQRQSTLTGQLYNNTLSPFRSPRTRVARQGVWFSSTTSLPRGAQFWRWRPGCTKPFQTRISARSPWCAPWDCSRASRTYWTPAKVL